MNDCEHDETRMAVITNLTQTIRVELIHCPDCGELVRMNHEGDR